MASHGNLADHEFEPTDEQLGELVHSAFAGVAARNEEALRKLHQQIAVLRASVLQGLASQVARK